MRKIDGENVQRIVINYHYIGSIKVPDMIPDVRINMNTRKGVSIIYAPAKQAV